MDAEGAGVQGHLWFSNEVGSKPGLPETLFLKENPKENPEGGALKQSVSWESLS